MIFYSDYKKEVLMKLCSKCQDLYLSVIKTPVGSTCGLAICTSFYASFRREHKGKEMCESEREREREREREKKHTHTYTE